MKRFTGIVCLALVLGCAPGDEEASEPSGASVAAEAAQAAGPDPTVVDPEHYSVEFENECVRILRVTYGPGETSPMHYHRPYVAVFLTGGGPFQFTRPGGEVGPPGDVIQGGTASYAAPESHAVEHLGDSAVEGVFVEIKGSACPGA